MLKGVKRRGKEGSGLRGLIEGFDVEAAIEGLSCYIVLRCKRMGSAMELERGQVSCF